MRAVLVAVLCLVCRATLSGSPDLAPSEFRVRLAPLAATPGKALVRLALPLNTARPVLYYNRDAFRRAKLNPLSAPKTWYDMAPVLGRLAEAGVACGYTTASPAWVMRGLT